MKLPFCCHFADSFSKLGLERFNIVPWQKEYWVGFTSIFINLRQTNVKIHFLSFNTIALSHVMNHLDIYTIKCMFKLKKG